MTCSHVTLPGGTRAIVCGKSVRERPCACGQRADLLCDWKVPGKKSTTCDKPLCPSCTFSPATDKDLCPEHKLTFAAWQERHP